MSFKPLEHLIALGVDGQVAADWLTLRKAKKAPATATAIKMIEKQADLAGMSLEEALMVSIEHSWRGFKAEWIAPKVQRHQPARVTAADERANVSMALTGRTAEVIDFLPGEARRVA